MKNRYLFLLFLSSAIFASCAKKIINPHEVTNKVYASQTDSLIAVIKQEEPVILADSLGKAIPGEWVGTVNFNLRKPNYVILHYTAQDSLAQTINTFTLVRTQVSAHYVVGKNGKIVHMLNDYLRAYHAGVSKWGNVTDMNSCSVGIEIDNNGHEPFTAAQMNSVLILLARLKKAYNIPAANFIGHADIAPARKPDPGRFFPWMLLAQKGFGYWPDIVMMPAPADFDSAIALRLMGYDTRDLPAAISAFKRHFVQTDDTPVLMPCDLDVLYNVYKKY